MKQPDHDFYRELVYLEPDGLLGAGERARLRRHLATCQECEALRGDLAEMAQLLESSRIEVEPDLVRRVLASLPPAGWEVRRPASWGVAAMLLALLGGTSVAVAALGGGLSAASPLAGTFLAVFDMLRSTALIGAGLLGASWQGVGMAIQDAVGGSPMSLTAFGIVVLGLDVLFLRFLIRASRSHAAARAVSDDLDLR